MVGWLEAFVEAFCGLEATLEGGKNITLVTVTWLDEWSS